MASSDPKPKPKMMTWYQGKIFVEILGRAVIFGKEYYDILLPTGQRKTVPANQCQKEKRKE